jgi:hypothetical protein
MRILVALGLAAATVAGPAARMAPAATTALQASELIGVWSGQWSAGDQDRGGAVEIILAREPGSPTVVAHVTFVDGALVDTARREGKRTRQGFYFELAGGGTLVLTLESDRRLTGEFAGVSDVPARFGSLELTPKA